MPIVAQGVDLHKSTFRDALCLRYGWQSDGLPSYCICGNKFTTNHALIYCDQISLAVAEGQIGQ